MPEEQQSSQPVTEGQELKPAEGSGNAEAKDSQAVDTSPSAPAQETDQRLEFINKTTGRTYKTIEEAEKGLKETVSYVGTLGQRAKHFDNLVEKIAKEENVTKEAAEKYVLSQLTGSTPASQSEVSNPTPAKEQRKPQDFQVEALAEQLQEERFLRKHPEAEDKLELAKAVSKAKDKDLVKAYEEDILPLVLEGKKSAYATQESKSPQAVVSSTEPVQTDDYESKLQDFKSGKISVMDMLKAKGLNVEGK